jgi:predicted anti-sigma-YlaC factor YlaD
MNCDQARDRFSDLREGSLLPAVVEEIEAHLSVCLECRQLQEAFGEALGALARFPEIEPARDLAERVVVAALAGRSAAGALVFRRPTREARSLPAWIRSIAAALAIATTGTLLLVTREAHALSRTATRLGTRAMNVGVQMVERQERLVEDVRGLPSLVGSAVSGRMERVGSRVEDYKRYIERRRQGDVEKKQGGLGSAATRVAEHFRTGETGAS